jgi:hypothetical protein
MPSAKGNIHYTGRHWNVPSKETVSAENTSAGTTDATGRYRAQIERSDPPLKMSGEVRCLSIVGRFFRACGEITDVQNADSSFELRGFILSGYDSGKHSTEPDYFHTGYTTYPLSEEDLDYLCGSWPTTTEYMTPIQHGQIDVTGEP